MIWTGTHSRQRRRRTARGQAPPNGIRVLLGAIAAGSLLLTGLTAAPAADAAARDPAGGPAYRSATATSAVQAAVTQAYVMARKLSRDAVSGIRKGSLRVATDQATGTSYALADFAPAARASAKIKDEFQDGASIAVFIRTGRQSWRLTHLTGVPFTCSRAIPAAVLTAWHLSRLASCASTAASQRQGAARARTALTRTTRAAGPAAASIGQDIASIALGQVGVSDTPVETYFGNQDCDPYSTMDGPPTPNANGCGVNSNFAVVNENEEWCSDFAKWAWQQAGVTADINTLNAGADSFYAWGLAQGESMPVDSDSPAVGDAVVFYEPGAITATTGADHVGIVTAVNPDGTVNLANGDFLGPDNIGVQYNTDIDLSTWASEVWSPGEQWVFVAPPASGQQAAPTERIVAPAAAVSGVSVPMAATASVTGGTISSYLWTFGDGVTASGPVISHVFGDAGLYTVAMTATSSLGTATTRTWNIDVTSGSSAVASTQGDQVWYTTSPLLQDVYTAASSGALSEESWDGASWLDQSIPGQASSAATATLNYPGADDQVVPQVFFRAADGTLAQTSGGDGDWSTSELAGQPSASSAIAASTVNDASSPRGAAPDVFYFTSSGQLTESSGVGGNWTTQALPGPATSQQGALAVADAAGLGHPSQLLFYVNSDGSSLTVTSSGAGGWHSARIRSPFGVAAGTPLSAISAGPGGLVQSVFFIDGHGQVAQASSALGSGVWVVTELPGPAASAASLTSVNYQLASGQTSAEVFYLDSSGQPVADTQTGLSWHAATLPGTATGILGAGAYPAAGGAQQLFLASGSGVAEDSAPTAGGSWTSSSLPDRPVTYAGRILLYAATPGDYANALAAAAAADLPAAQVTDNFDVAWAATSSGDYLVLAIGTAAVDALYVNNCGWPDPSGDDAGTTPFYYYVPPFYGLPGADAFVNATAATASQAVAAATDATYYALNDALPPGVTSIPALSGPDYLCEGSPS
jgi:hypothetical protein